MPTSAYACGGATGAPASANGTSAVPYADPNAAPMNRLGAYTPPTNPDCDDGCGHNARRSVKRVRDQMLKASGG